MPRSQIEKRRYRTVMYATYNSELARKARGWSDQKIFERLGVRVPKSTPKKRTIPRKSTPQRTRLERDARLRLNKFTYAVAMGYTYDQAYQARYKSYDHIESKAPPVKGVPVDKPATKTDRLDRWSQWAIDNEYPRWVEDLAENINQSMGFDVNASYGWAVVYYSYINNKSIDEVKQLITVDPFDGDIYVVMRSVQ